MDQLSKQYRITNKALTKDAQGNEVISHTFIPHDDAAAPNAMPGGAAMFVPFSTPVDDTFPDGAIVEATFVVIDVPAAPTPVATGKA